MFVIRFPRVLTLALSCTLAFTACTAVGRGSNGTPVDVNRSAGGGRVYVVAPYGNDHNPGSAAQPFRTFSKSLAVLRAGDTLLARGGTYDEQVKATSISPGTSDHRILVRNYPNERPVIRGQFWLAYPSYWTVDGINVTWASSNPQEHMVQLYGGTGWVLQNSEIWGQGAGTPISKSGLLIGDGRHNNLGTFTVRNNCIHDNETNVYVDDTLQSPDPHGYIERNIIYNAYDGRGVKLGPPGEAGGPKHVVVQYNTIYRSYQNVSLSRGATDNVVTHNLLGGASAANVGTYRLYGTGNVATDNVSFGGGYFADGGVSLLGNHAVATPRFDAIGCGGFRTADAATAHYGRYGR
jgi:hypothetical protein